MDSQNIRLISFDLVNVKPLSCTDVKFFYIDNYKIIINMDMLRSYDKDIQKMLIMLYYNHKNTKNAIAYNTLKAYNVIWNGIREKI